MSDNYGGYRPRVSAEATEQVRQAVKSSDRSYIKACHIGDDLPDIPQTTIGDAFLELERDGDLELFNSPKSGVKVYRIRMGD